MTAGDIGTLLGCIGLNRLNLAPDAWIFVSFRRNLPVFESSGA